MMEYPFTLPIAELIEFEKSHKEWVGDIGDLTTEQIDQYLSKCLKPDFRICLYILSHALDQEKVTEEQASQAFKFLQESYFEMLSCFRALSLLPSTLTDSLNWMTDNLKDDDIIDHVIYNLKNKRGKNTLNF